ncbi:MAG: phenylphosphate carboxylase subunit delta [Zetaproteobacteria bacterium]|nr:MAG: phenylphosphate carboxylase subunit delta [Zetaproteobacteria bacterium]
MSWEGYRFPFQEAARVRLVIFDVDGVLTDGKIRLDDAGREHKAFDVRDGHGIKLLQRAGVQCAIITGRRSALVERRAQELGIAWVRQGATNKLDALEKVLADAGMSAEEAAFFGDDVLDVPPMRACRLGFAPADAHPAVRRAADWVASFPGGRGAVRQMCEGMILAHGMWEKAIARRYGVRPEDCGWPSGR